MSLELFLLSVSKFGVFRPENHPHVDGRQCPNCDMLTTCSINILFKITLAAMRDPAC